jgi:hypothetical protein
MNRAATPVSVLFATLTALAHASLAQGANQGPPGAVALLEDDTGELIGQLNNDGGVDGTKISRDFRDFYSGVCSVRVTPFQRFRSQIKGWSFPIAEKPRPGEYRYLRFAWKRVGGEGIMIQLRNNAGSWNQRYFAGKVSQITLGWGRMLKVAAEAPSEWTVVTRDLFKDFGSMTIIGFALTPMEGGTAGFFDHVYLGRTVKDLDGASAAAFGKDPLAKTLSRRQLEKLWDDLRSRDVTAAGPAARALVAGRKQALPFLVERLKEKPARLDAGRILRLIDDLDNDEFQVREKAFRDLERLGDVAVPLLEKAVKKTTSAEVRTRIEILLKKQNLEEWALPSEQLRILRVIRILEWSGTADARQTLEQLAKDPAAADLEKDVRSSLARLRKRS